MFIKSKNKKKVENQLIHDKMKTILAIFGTAIAVIILLVLVGAFGGGTLGQINPGLTVSNSSSTVGTTAVKILTSASGVQYRAISNLSSETVYLSFKSTSTGFIAGTGYALVGSTTLEMTDQKGNLWTGDIYGLTSTATSNVATSQF